jgi:predicted nuclease of restriction endonuclease-like (RecB) superfamily
VKLTKTFFKEISALIHAARDTVARGVDLVQVHTNFEIGRRIIEQEQKGKGRAAYGKEVIKALAERLTEEFGKGYSASNLAYMRSFFLLYEERGGIFQTLSGKFETPSKGKRETVQKPIFQTLTGKLAAKQIVRKVSAKSAALNGARPFALSWSHYVFLTGIKNSDERSFYEIESASENWTVRELKRQYDSSLYERLALSRDKAGIRRLAREGQLIHQAADLLKEPLVLEFLGLEERHCYSESDLEAAVINQIERFLLEMGKGFCFRRGSDDLRLTASITLLIWFSIIVFYVVMC